MSAIAFFVSPHGFGHAARAAAVMEALDRRRPGIDLHVFTTVPRWFFDDTLRRPFAYYPVACDVGLIQSDPLSEDLPATVAALERLWGGIREAARAGAAVIERHRVDLVVSDIAPLGLLAARRAGRPGLLVENFTWDWIYRGGYTKAEPRLEEFARRYEEVASGADLHLQARPFCAEREGATTVSPVARARRLDRSAVRRAVGLEPGDDRPLVLMTMGGMGWRQPAGGGLGAGGGAFFVTLGGVDAVRREESRLALPDRSPIFPPDLVAGADLVVAKLGYSTVCECWRGAARLLYLDRPSFPEAAVLADFARTRLGAERLESGHLENGSWLSRLDEHLVRPRPELGGGDGAAEIARLLLARLA